MEECAQYSPAGSNWSRLTRVRFISEKFFILENARRNAMGCCGVESSPESRRTCHHTRGLHPFADMSLVNRSIIGRRRAFSTSLSYNKFTETTYRTWRSIYRYPFHAACLPPIAPLNSVTAVGFLKGTCRYTSQGV